MIVPLIKEYLEVKVKNDEHLVKMAAVCQRAIAATSNAKDTGDYLSEDEKKQLLLEVQAIGDEQVLIETKTQKLIKVENKG